MLKRLKFLALGLALVLPLAACDDDEPPPPVVQPPQVGSIAGAALIVAGVMTLALAP